MAGSTVELSTRPLPVFHHRGFPTASLMEAKGTTTVSVCLPARNEAATVGDIVRRIRAELVSTHRLVDEVVVIDDHSTDATATMARAAGARVVDAASVLPDHGPGHGKGEVLWKSLLVSEGDIVLWCDADIRDFGPHFITGLLGPLLCEPGIVFAKGFYERPEQDRVGGGRVTELLARPLLSLLFPDLAAIRQPLSGEYGGRREVLEQLPFVEGYGVDVGLLIDLVRLVGPEAIAQVDLDLRLHRNRPLCELSPQATAVAQTILRRVDPDMAPAAAQLLQPLGEDVLATEVTMAERPPMIEVAEYRERHPAE